jgi:YfiH family protein
MIRWQPPGPYRIGFTTRAGGVSDGVFASLNLAGGHDDPVAVSENRRIACAELGLDADALAFSRQRHSATVNRGRAGTVEVGDGLWTDEPDLPLMALGADCAPIALVSTEGPPALAVVHAGWRGLAGGIVEAAVAALGGRRSAAMVGPAIGPCCYEVGPEVSARFDPDLTRNGILDLWGAARRALERAGVGQVEQVGLCTRCNPELFFSFRATGRGAHGAQGVIGALEH